MPYSKIFSTVIKDLRPQKAKYKAAELMVQRVNVLIKKHKIKAIAQAGGSYAKGTNLKGDFDVDIFIKFSLIYENEDLSKLLEKVLKPLKPTKVHGSRDYFQLVKNKISFEFIPVLNISQCEQALNITDCSPLHVQWYKKKGKNTQDDIRLAKMFCKSAKVYGAESYIRGFSGHSLDILIVHYGNFLNVLQASQKWKSKTVIDPENAHKGNALNTLNKSKIDGPLIIIDPVQPLRNAASGLHEEKFVQFKEAAKLFLNNPTIEQFKIKKPTVTQLKKKFPYLLTVNITGHKGKEDVVGSKMLKVFEELRSHLHEYALIESDWEFDKKKKAILWFGLAKNKREKEFVFSGPPLRVKDHVTNFKKKHKKTYTKSGKIYAKGMHKLIKGDAVVKDILNQSHLKQRMKSWSVTLHG